MQLNPGLSSENMQRCTSRNRSKLLLMKKGKEKRNLGEECFDQSDARIFFVSIRHAYFNRPSHIMARDMTSTHMPQKAFMSRKSGAWRAKKESDAAFCHTLTVV